MSNKTVIQLLLSFGKLALVALLYYLTARLGFLLTIPPDNMPLIWLSSGLALAVLMIWGWQMGLGIFIGSLLANWGYFSDPLAMPVALAIASGATLQGWAAFRLIKSRNNTLLPTTIREILFTIGVTALATLIAPLMGLTGMCLAGFMPWKDFLQHTWLWWLSDFIGILVFAPGLVVLALHWNKRQIHEPLLWPLICLMVGVTLLAYSIIQNGEQRRVNDIFRRDAAEMTILIHGELDQETQTLDSIRAFYASSNEISADEFSAFTTPLLERSSAATRFVWIQRVSLADRSLFEESVRGQGFENFKILERDLGGGYTPAENRIEYFPVFLVNPVSPEKSSYGFDLGSDSAWRKAILQARDSGELALTPPIYSEQETDIEASIMMMMPVYRNGFATQTLEDRRENLDGLIVGTFRVENIVASALQGTVQHDLELYLFDVGESDQAQFLAFYPSLSGPQTLSLGELPVLHELEKGLFHTDLLEIAGREWLAVLRPGPDYGIESRGWASLPLLIGFLVTGTAMYYVSNRQKAQAALARSEIEFRALSDNALTGVARYEFNSGKLLYVNEAAAQMLGYGNPDELIGLDFGRFFGSEAQQSELSIILSEVGHVRGHEIEIHNQQDQLRQLLFSGSVNDKGIVSVTLVDLTDRIRAGQEFRQLSRVVSQTTDLVVITDTKGKIEYVNPAFEQLTGYTCAEVLGKTPRFLKSGKHDRVFYENLWATISSGEVFRAEVFNLKKNGEEFIEAKMITPLRDADGFITHYVSTGKDITQSRQAEASLRESQLMVNMLVESLPQFIYVKDASGRIIFINDRYCQTLHKSREEIIGKTDFELHPKELAEKYTRDERWVLENGQTLELEEVHIGPNNQQLFVQVIKTPFIDSNGQITGTMGVFWDITQRKEAEQALRESEARILSTISDNLTSADLFVYVRDADGHFHYEYVSSSIERLMGVSPAEAIKDVNAVRSVFLPEYLDQLIEAENESWANLSRLEMELCLRHGYTGEICWVLLRATPYQRADGSTHWYGVHLDITDRKQSEELLARQSAQLRILYEASQRLNRSLDLQDIYQAICDFMSNIALNDAVAISAYDHAAQMIHCRAYWLDQKWLDVSSFPSIPLEKEGSGTQSLVIRSGQSMLVNDYQTFLQSSQTRYLVNGEINEIVEEASEDADVLRSALIVPLKDGESVIGVIQVMSYQLDAYDEDQLKLLESLALHVVSAEKNALLYARVQAELKERMQTEAALRRREIDYRLIADNTGDVIWILDLETEKFSYVSPSVEKLRGYSPQDVLTQTMDEVLTPASLEYMSAELPGRIEAFAQSGQSVTYTDILDQTKKNGSPASTEVATTIVTNDSGKMQVVGISRDITARHQAEKLQQTVYNIADAAQSSESLNELYPQIHAQIRGVMYADNFSIALYEKSTNTLSYVYSVDAVERVREGAYPVGVNLASSVIHTRRSQLYSEFDGGREQAEGEILPKMWLGVPLTTGGEIIGVMSVQHYTDANAFSEREQRILEFVSTQVATVIERKKAEEYQREQQNLLEYHYHLVEIMNSISTRFINLSVDQIDAEIDLALGLIAGFEQVDRSYIFLINRELATMTNTHEWCAPGVKPQIDHLKNLPVRTFPWWMERLERHQEVYIPLVSQLPPEAKAEREILEAQGVQSLLVVPIISNNVLTGFVGFDAVRQPRIWDADSILIVEMMSDIISNALIRKNTEEILRSSEEKFAKAFRSSPDAIVISSLVDSRIIEVNDGFCRTTGYQREEVLGNTSLDNNLWVSLEDRNRLLDQLATEGRMRNMEAKFRLKSGELRDGLISGEAIELEGGEKCQLLVVRDISELKQAAILQETVYRIAEAAQNTEALYSLYPQIQCHIASVMSAEEFSIALYDEDSDSIYVVFSVGERSPLMEPVHPDEGLTAHVLRKGESLLYVPEKDSLDFEMVDEMPKVWLGVPLIAHGKTIGVMAVQHYSDAQIYTEREKHILEFVSSQVATAIDRKRAEEAVRLVEKRNQALIENAPDGIAMLDAEGRFIFCSPTVKRIYGYAPEEMLGTVASEAMHPDDRQRVEEQLQQIGEDPTQIINAIYRVQHKNGHYIWIECAYANMFHDPVVNAWVLNFRDITEQKLAREMMERSQASLEVAQSISRLGSWELDPVGGKGLSWSKEMYRLFCRAPEQGVPEGEEFFTMVHMDDRQRLMDAQQRAIETGSTESVEYRSWLAEGGLRYYRAAIQPVKDEQGNLIHLTGTVQDVTESRLMEWNLRERMKELTCLFKVGRLLQDNALSEESLGQQVVNYVSQAMQFPDHAETHLELGGKHYATERYHEEMSCGITSIITVEDEVYGQLSVYCSTGEHEFLPEEQELLNNVTNLLGVWLERRRAENNAIYRQKLLEKVLSLGKNVTAITDLDQCLRAIHQNIQKGLGFDRVGLFLLDAETQIIRGAYGTSRTGQMENNSWYSMAASDWPSWQIALQNPGGISYEADYTADYQPSPDNEMYGVKQHLSLAAWAGDKPVALATVDNLITQKVITSADMEALQLFAGYAGLAIENARLHTNLEQRVEERTAEVRRSEATYRALFENSNDGIFLLAPTGEDLLANRQALNMLGYTHEEYQALTRQDRNAMVAPEQRAHADERFAAALRGEYIPLYERTFIRKDGKPLDVEINLSSVRDPSGQVIMLQSVVRDITVRKKAEEALRQSRDRLSMANVELEKASRMKDEFLASMSHELRTPLTGILGLSEALQLQTYGPLSEKQLKALSTIEGCGRHLLTLINDILDLSKIEAGKFDMEFEPCSVVDICQASLQLVKGMAHQKKQNVSFSIQPTSITIRADSRRLKQMLVNLLSNAVKFTPEGGYLGLDVQADRKKGIVLFSVWDKGIGIEPENVDKLFLPFIQLDSSLARQYSGTGLGLSLVKRMAELHEGSISVESAPGQGSRFTVCLPWSEEGGERTPGLKVAKTTMVKSALVIEDNDVDIEVTTRYLQELGLSFNTHPTVAGSLKKAAALEPDVILLDLDLPDGLALELLSWFRTDERTREIPVIITSVIDQRADTEKLGAFGYLLKPYSRDDLRVMLEKVAALDTFVQKSSKAKSLAPLVMVVDDNEQLLEMLTDFIDAKGYRSVGLTSGADLLERIPEFRPALIMMDIQMPGMDGLETIRRLRAHEDEKLASTPVIAVTAYAMPGDRERCLAAGADEYLSKPVVLTELMEQVERILKKPTNQ